jgi:hypothetical protein
VIVLVTVTPVDVELKEMPAPAVNDLRLVVLARREVPAPALARMIAKLKLLSAFCETPTDELLRRDLRIRGEKLWTKLIPAPADPTGPKSN